MKTSQAISDKVRIHILWSILKQELGAKRATYLYEQTIDNFVKLELSMNQYDLDELCHI